ncbi:YbaB/EbfC family nucleoid-associated protein [Nonomuraea sp. NPDC049714]|uniref:YbaB/EbfC family nucleoid-associated protein n=1 Tax=Nonomuraea sp. NPDC049714 TaxID=3364357 RepID=UPI0037BDA187
MFGFELDPRDIRPQDVERAAEQAARVETLLAEEGGRLAEIVGTGRGDGGHVHAAVAADGRVLKISIEPRAVREGSEALSEAIVLTVRRAQQDALRQVDALVRESLEEALPGTSLDPAALRERLGRLLD